MLGNAEWQRKLIGQLTVFVILLPSPWTGCVSWFAFLLVFTVWRKNYLTLAKRTRKSTQVCKTRTYVRTCDGWPNGFASRLTSSRKSKKAVNFTHTIDLRSTCVDLGWVAKRWNTCVVDLRTNLSSTKVNAPSRRKWVTKRNASWPQVENLRRLASPFGQGFKGGSRGGSIFELLAFFSIYFYVFHEKSPHICSLRSKLKLPYQTTRTKPVKCEMS